MTRRQMSEADWMAIARVFHALHQRRAAAEAASGPARDSRKERLRAKALSNTAARREGGDDDGTT